MGLVQRLTANDLKRILEDSDSGCFSHEACQFIIDYYEELGEDVELDVVKIRSQFVEVEQSLSALLGGYGKGSTVHRLTDTFLILN